MSDNPLPFQDPDIRLRRKGTRRYSRAEPALNERIFLPRRPKGRRVYGFLIVLLVIGGGILQFQWMQRIRKEEVVPNALAEKLGLWMMQKRGGAPEEGLSSPGAPGSGKVHCEACMGSGNALGGENNEICPLCLGVGFHMIRRFDPADRICPLCAGMGRVELPDTGAVGTCPRCDGRGLVRSQTDAAPAGN